MTLRPLSLRALMRGAARAALTLGLTFGAAASAQAQTAPAPAVAPSASLADVPPAAGPGPALWVVRDADSTIYLFGTVHVLKPITGWGTPALTAAFDAADQVWFEIANPDDQAAVLPLIQQHGLDKARPLSSLLTAEELAQLDAAAKDLGASAAQMDPMRPWLAAMTLQMAPVIKAGYRPGAGVELMLKSRAEAAGKPIHAFETADRQIRILAGLDEADQLALLRQTLNDAGEGAGLLDGMVEDWVGGDVEGLAATMNDKMGETIPAVHEALLTRRNADWVGQIRTLLEGSGTVFIAVGAGHLSGPDSVQAQLAAQGVTAERVQ